MCVYIGPRLYQKIVFLAYTKKCVCVCVTQVTQESTPSPCCCYTNTANPDGREPASTCRHPRSTEDHKTEISANIHTSFIGRLLLTLFLLSSPYLLLLSLLSYIISPLSPFSPFSPLHSSLSPPLSPFLFFPSFPLHPSLYSSPLDTQTYPPGESRDQLSSTLFSLSLSLSLSLSHTHTRLHYTPSLPPCISLSPTLFLAPSLIYKASTHKLLPSTVYLSLFLPSLPLSSFNSLPLPLSP